MKIILTSIISKSHLSGQKILVILLKNIQGAIFGLGSGVDQPALHNPDFDFPDALIPTGISLYKSIYNFILEK